jgi:cyclopropane fatty-acyl-phospholipid synthase-like methyltransferase
MEKGDKIVSFYDQFVAKQEKIGVNSRHLHILDKLVSAGLSGHHHVLEIGCGIGTVSQLIAKKASKGEVLAVDISPESIRKAKEQWKHQQNLNFEISDMKNFQKPGRSFDFFVFPDVLEHIPIDQHNHLFQTINGHSHQDSVIFVHIPAPRFLEWMIKNEPEKLQVIDQPLDTGELIKSISANGFYLDKMETYSIFYEENDYQYFVFRKQKPIEKTSPKNKWLVFWERLRISIKHKEVKR